MVALAAWQPGFLGLESARDEGVGVTVSYWTDEASILAWKRHGDHALAHARGRQRWYSAYTTRVCEVRRAYSWGECTRGESGSGWLEGGTRREMHCPQGS
jgi:heme-degrading monooxygenase HmoA